MTNLELQKHLLRLWLDGKPLPQLQAKLQRMPDWADYTVGDCGPWQVPVLSWADYRIKPKEYKVDQPVWGKTHPQSPWLSRHYAGFEGGHHLVWVNGTTSHSVSSDSYKFSVVEITDVDPNV